MASKDRTTALSKPKGSNIHTTKETLPHLLKKIRPQSLPPSISTIGRIVGHSRSIGAHTIRQPRSRIVWYSRRGIHPCAIGAHTIRHSCSRIERAHAISPPPSRAPAEPTSSSAPAEETSSHSPSRPPAEAPPAKSSSSRHLNHLLLPA